MLKTKPILRPEDVRRFVVDLAICTENLEVLTARTEAPLLLDWGAHIVSLAPDSVPVAVDAQERVERRLSPFAGLWRCIVDRGRDCAASNTCMQKLSACPVGRRSVVVHIGFLAGVGMVHVEFAWLDQQQTVDLSSDFWWK